MLSLQESRLDGIIAEGFSRIDIAVEAAIEKYAPYHAPPVIRKEERLWDEAIYRAKGEVADYFGEDIPDFNSRVYERAVQKYEFLCDIHQIHQN